MYCPDLEIQINLTLMYKSIDLDIKMHCFELEVGYELDLEVRIYFHDLDVDALE
jgi:hypothetical protein